MFLGGWAFLMREVLLYPPHLQKRLSRHTYGGGGEPSEFMAAALVAIKVPLFLWPFRSRSLSLSLSLSRPLSLALLAQREPRKAFPPTGMEAGPSSRVLDLVRVHSW